MVRRLRGSRHLGRDTRRPDIVAKRSVRSIRERASCFGSRAEVKARRGSADSLTRSGSPSWSPGAAPSVYGGRSRTRFGSTMTRPRSRTCAGSPSGGCRVRRDRTFPTEWRTASRAKGRSRAGLTARCLEELRNRRRAGEAGDGLGGGERNDDRQKQPGTILRERSTKCRPTVRPKRSVLGLDGLRRSEGLRAILARQEVRSRRIASRTRCTSGPSAIFAFFIGCDVSGMRQPVASVAGTIADNNADMVGKGATHR